MVVLILLLYGLPVYLIFFRYKLVPLTIFWKVFLWIPPVAMLLFLWFALGRYTPLAQAAYAQAPVVQISPAVGGFVTELAVLQKLQQPSAAIDPQEQAAQIQELTAELERLHKYLEKASTADPIRQDVQPTVRQAIEALNDAKLALERTTVTAPTDGVVSNLQLTAGTYARPAIPVASVIDTTRWRLVAAVPENWLEKIRPGDDVYFSIRNYPGRVRTAKVQHVGRGVLQGQGIPSGNLPDTDPRQTRQPDTPQPGQKFQVIIALQDDQPTQPLRVGLTGRATIFAGGGFPVANQLAPILHTVFSWLDYLHPKPSPLAVLLGVAAVGGCMIIWRTKLKNINRI